MNNVSLDDIMNDIGEPPPIEGADPPALLPFAGRHQDTCPECGCECSWCLRCGIADCLGSCPCNDQWGHYQ